MNGISSDAILCRRCLDRPISQQELAKYLDDYVSTLPENLRASAEVYAKRLEMCETCEHRVIYTCQKCGCYCQARAAKKGLSCPIPAAPRWEAET